MTKQVVDLTNSLTNEQRQEITDKIEKLIERYNRDFNTRHNMYFAGVVDGMNNIYKMINEIDDDYNLGN